MIDLYQLLDHLSIGVIVIDESLRVVLWNRWVSEHSLLNADDVKGKPIFDIFPGLNRKGFLKKTKEVFKSGRPVFFTQKISQYIFPFPTTRSYIADNLSTMQQTVILSPIKDKSERTKHVLVSVFDVSDWVHHQNQLLRSKKELEKLSQIDELTQIPNRRAIMDKLKEELSIHNRKKRPFALAMLDIDYFKEINDSMGHQCGDLVLYELASLLTSGLRGYDMVGRYGGEEFVLLLPETNKEQAVQVCERLRETIAKQVFRYDDEEIRLTVSMGISFKPSGDECDIERMLKSADDFLYEAKESGRNRVKAAL